MSTFFPLLASVTIVLSAAQSPAQEQKEQKKADNPPPAPLVPAKLAEQLKLNDDQRQKITALEQEFHKQRKAALTLVMFKIQGIIDKIERDEEPAPALAITAAVMTTVLEVKRTQGAYEGKIMALLNDEQQRKYAAWQKLRISEKKEQSPEYGHLANGVQHPGVVANLVVEGPASDHNC